MSPIYIDGAHLYEADLDFYQRTPKIDMKARKTLAVNFSWVGCCANVQWLPSHPCPVGQKYEVGILQ